MIIILSIISILSIVGLGIVLYLYLTSKKKVRFRVKPHHDIELAFELGGKRFYKFKDEMHIPVERAMSVKDYYEELECRIDREYLEALFLDLTKLLDKGKLVQASALIEIAKSRLEHITNAELVYKLASVVYFSEEEDPYDYDLAMGDKKIAFWKAHDLDAFFLKTHISEFLPSFESSEMNLKSYLKAQGEDISRGLEYHLSIMSEHKGDNDTKAIIEQQLKALKHYKAYTD